MLAALMCLVLLSYKQLPGYPLIVAANRDEFFARPTRPAGFWDDRPGLLAGRDLLQGGTWLGIDQSGRLAAVTNYREPSEEKADFRSRGFLVSDYLSGGNSASDYLRTVAAAADQYDGFNLFAGDPDVLYFISSYTPEPIQLEPGIHGISNGNLDYPWPKVIAGKHAMQKLLDSGGIADPESYFQLLADRVIPVDESLPDTDYVSELDRMLAPIFVRGGLYGTRSSTVIIFHDNGKILFTERSYDAEGDEIDTVQYEIAA